MPCETIRFPHGSSVIVNFAPPERTIEAGGETFRFEFHHYCGPTMIGKRGNPISWFPPHKSPFWDALHWWLKQGKRVDENGRCIFEWETALVHIVRRVGRRTFEVLG